MTELGIPGKIIGLVENKFKQHSNAQWTIINLWHLEVYDKLTKKEEGKEERTSDQK